MIKVGNKLYHHGVICERGHVLTLSPDSEEDNINQFCPECGAKVLMECASCNRPILGWSFNPHVAVIAHVDPQPFCRFCGKPFPWTDTKKKIIEDNIDSTDKLTQEEKKAMKDNLNEILRETPETEKAAIRLVEALKKFGKGALKETRSLIVDISSETGKKVILDLMGKD